MEDWGVEGPAVGSFLGGEEGDEFAGEPDYAVGLVVSGKFLVKGRRRWISSWREGSLTSGSKPSSNGRQARPGANIRVP